VSGARNDPWNLQRFVDAQQGVHEQALAELRAGRKRTHWIWFELPQLAALGRSGWARHYGLQGLAEAVAYWTHPVLGPRLEACVRALNAHPQAAPEAMLGPVDAIKFRSCATLFAQVAGPRSAFGEALAIFWGGRGDEATLALIGPGEGAAGAGDAG